MTSYYSNKRQSLVEKKKLQWAKEREELENLTSATWGINTKYSRNKLQSTTSVDLTAEDPNRRRESLPPIYDPANSITTCQYLKMERDICAETSGYGSDSAKGSTPEYFSPQEEGDANSVTSDDRQKWVDSTLKMRHVWEPQEEIRAVPETPGWLRRGLQRNCEIMVAMQSPDNETLDQDGSERPYTSSSSSYRTHIRGQNVPLEPIELAERERKRQIAMEHQNAIKAQLEERERRRKEEKERRLKEEAEEDHRIRREQEMEDERLQQEAAKKREKQEMETKRNEAMREALEQAEREAKEKKNKQKMLKHPQVLAAETARSEDVVEEQLPEEKPVDVEAPKKTKEEPEILETKEEPPEEPPEPTVVVPDCDLIVTATQNAASMSMEPFPNNLQFAMIVPPLNLGPNIPIAVPVILSSERVQERTENRVLTPSLYRLKVPHGYCDSSTQTDFPPETPIVEKLKKLDLHLPKEKLKDPLEDRPKWGVNRPPTRYVKQSEKDPIYQRRKLRQKNRQFKIKRYSPHSSDDSGLSPRAIQNETIKRKSRGLWRKQESSQSRIGMIQREIVSLESDKDQIYCSPNSASVKGFYGRTYKQEDREVNILTIKHSKKAVLDDLQRLKNGLMLKQQEQWDDPDNSFEIK